MTVGVFGGAFDPPHLGHVALARAAVPHFALDRLLVRVVVAPGHKPVSAAADVRLHLAELAFAGIPGVEIGLDPHARTVDSLEALAQDERQLDDVVFLVGADEFAAFLEWKEPDRVLELARLGVATRPGHSLQRVDGVLARLARPERISFFEIPPLDISSTAVRLRVVAGEEVDLLVPPAVADEIERLGLYRRAVGHGYTEGEDDPGRTRPA